MIHTRDEDRLGKGGPVGSGLFRMVRRIGGRKSHPGIAPESLRFAASYLDPRQWASRWRLTSQRSVTLIVTELVVMEPTPEDLALRERAPGVLAGEIEAATGADLLIAGEVPEIRL